MLHPLEIALDQRSRQASGVATIRLERRARAALAASARRISSIIGDSDTPGVAARVDEAAGKFLKALSEQHLAQIELYREAALAALVIDGAHSLIEGRPLPEILAPPQELHQDPAVAELAVRSQIILAAVGERAFAFDAENEGRIVRLVGNFEGGGAVRLAAEEKAASERMSSHHGGLLGAHTEGPYYATQAPRGRHAPAPSSLILSALYNPLHEPTSVLPTESIIDALAGLDVLSLAQPHFAFAASDSYAAGVEGPVGVPVLEMTRTGVFALRFNVHRVKPAPGAPAAAAAAIEAFKAATARVRPHRVQLTSSRMLLINNTQAMHGRDVIRDNRRLLIRLFGCRAGGCGEIITKDPLIVRA